MDLVQTKCADHFGKLEGFDFAVTRDHALAVLNRFVTEKLPQFGTYQDAMITDEPWMYHSHIGIYLNAGMLEPLEVIAAAESAYHNGVAPLNAVERIYPANSWLARICTRPLLAKNAILCDGEFLRRHRPLPDFFWSGKTDMKCLAQSIQQTDALSYAHHIQRLMVLGNFEIPCGLVA